MSTPPTEPTPTPPDMVPVPAALPPAMSPQPSVWSLRLFQLAGLAVLFYETLYEDVDRPYLLLVALAMMMGGQGAERALKAVGDLKAIADEVRKAGGS